MWTRSKGILLYHQMHGQRLYSIGTLIIYLQHVLYIEVLLMTHQVSEAINYHYIFFSLFDVSGHFCTGINENDGKPDPPDGNPPPAPSCGPFVYISCPRKAWIVS